MISTFVLVFVGRATAVLLVHFEVMYEPIEVLLRHRPVVIDRFVLVLPSHHLGLIELIPGVHLFEVELQFIFVGDCDSEASDSDLFVVESFAEGGEVHVAVPLGPIFGLDDLLGVHVKQTPSCVQVV